tara:strand:+ start:5378 stop:5566 length:189 start_codon:yes stop_codon:yes gene_type:complete
MTWQPIETAPSGVDVLIVSDGVVKCANYDYGEWTDIVEQYFVFDKVTHWSPFPKPPKVKNKC